ncbi:MAG TPA: hypothetical protein PKB03_00965 [Baekduia sp.]|nr:hypothetical protein [Baekduia sp.]
MDDGTTEPGGPEQLGQHPAGDPDVSLADAAIAAAIGRAAAQGRGADRAPTLEQLLAAFGEGQPTREARARVSAALRMADVTAEPDLATAAPGQRLSLSAQGGSAASGRPRALTGLFALIALVLIFGTAFGVSRLLGDGGDRASSSLDDTTPFTISSVTDTTTTAATTTASTSTQETGTETTSPATTSTTATQTTATETTETTSKADKRAEERKRQRAAANRPITVRVDAGTRATFLCVDDGNDNVLFNGTLAGKKTFKARRVRLNVGLATTRVTVNGNELKITGSPAGFDITRKAVKPLAVGQRPCA